MANIRFIDKTYVETPDFQEPTEDLTLRINLSDGQEVLFTAEKEFYTPRRITTNLSDVVQLENLVEYSPNNVAIIKLQNGQSQLTRPQYYLNSIVRDIYKQYQLDTFFTELDDDLAVPEYVGTEFEKRQLALNTLLNLEDLAVASAVNDVEGIAQATEDIDNNFSELAGLETLEELGSAELTTPEEEDQLTSLDFVGLATNGSGVPGGYVSSPSVGAAIPGVGGGTTGIAGTSGTVGTPTGVNSISPGDTVIVRPDGSTIIAPGDPINTLTQEQLQDLGLPEDLGLPPDEGSLVPDENGLFSSEDTSADIISPVPTVDETALIRMDGGLPIVAGQVPGLEIVNQAIQLINTGIQKVEGSMQNSVQAVSTTTGTQQDCKTITVAKGKKGFGVGKFRFGKKPERSVARSDIENKLALVKTDISNQENSETPILRTSSGVPTLIKTQKSALFSRLIGSIARAGVLNGLSKTVGAPMAITATTSAVPNGYQPMTKQQILEILNKTKQELEKILAQGC